MPLTTAGLPVVAFPTGLETVAVDTNASNGATPQQALMPISQIGSVSNFRNAIIGGNFSTNPWQYGTSFTSISNTASITADKWWALGGASSSISVSRQALSAGDIPGFNYCLQFGRAAANTDTAAIAIGQVVETAGSLRYQGQNVVVSFWMLAGANLSSTAGAVTVKLYTGTDTNGTAANMLAGSWTATANPISATVNPTTAWTRYSVATSAAIANTVTEIGVSFSYVPVGTAGANDWIKISGVQLESGTSPSVFEHRQGAIELELCQRSGFQVNEPASAIPVAAGMNTGANAQSFVMATPVPLVATPTVTVSAGTFKTNQAGVVTATTIAAGAASTVNFVNITSNSAGTAGQGTLLQGAGGAGYIRALCGL